MSFKEASRYTLDPKIKEILINCSNGKEHSKFKIKDNKIYSHSGNVYNIPSKPINLCNIIHDIIYEKEKIIHNIPVSSNSKNIINNLDISIYRYAKNIAKQLGKNDYYIDELYSCIFTGIFLNYIKLSDIKSKNGIIETINGVDVKIPKIINN